MGRKLWKLEEVLAMKWNRVVAILLVIGAVVLGVGLAGALCFGAKYDPEAWPQIESLESAIAELEGCVVTSGCTIKLQDVVDSIDEATAFIEALSVSEAHQELRLEIAVRLKQTTGRLDAADALVKESNESSSHEETSTLRDVATKRLNRARELREEAITLLSQLRELLAVVRTAFANRVVRFRPGARANRDFSDQVKVLGPPDMRNDPAEGFLHLGVGGSITVEFTDSEIVDRPGPDLRIWGDPENDELIKVEVSQDGVSYQSLGFAGESVSLDLARVGLRTARFVRITDDGSQEQVGAFPGAELDAVQSLHAPSTVLLSDDFEERQADGWDLQSGWQVKRVDGSYALTGQGHKTVWLDEGWDWTDYSFRFRLKLNKGVIHVNCRNNDGRYLFAISNDFFDLNKEAPWGHYTNWLAQNPSAAFNLGDWYDVEIVCVGGRLQAYVDGVLIIDHIDDDPLTHGTIAFETLDNSQAYVDDVEVIELR